MMRLVRSLLMACLGLTVVGVGRAEEASLPRSTPEAEGVSSAAVLDLVTTLDAKVDTMHSVMVVRHGKVIAEAWWKPEAADKPHVLWSLSKSFTSTAIGLAVAEGKLSLDDSVLKFFPDQAPAEPSENLKAMKVRHLLSMSGGHEKELKFDVTKGPTVKEFFAYPVAKTPGTFFVYNSPGSYMLSAILTKVTGQTVVEYLQPRLFEPLGIAAPKWDASAEGYSFGGWGLHLKTEDIAKFGQLYLQKGQWHGKQILPAEYVAEATTKQVSNGSNPESDWNQGYGFQFWMCRHDAFRGDGRAGQFCVVLPEQETVVAMTADTKDLQGVLNIVWDKLLPALEADALPDNLQAVAALKARTADLTAKTQ